MKWQKIRYRPWPVMRIHVNIYPVNKRAISYLLLCLFVVSVNSIASDKPHKLRVSDNGRYLISEISGVPIFLMGDTGWVAHIRGYRSEIDYYLHDRKI